MDANIVLIAAVTVLACAVVLMLPVVAAAMARGRVVQAIRLVIALAAMALGGLVIAAVLGAALADDV